MLAHLRRRNVAGVDRGEAGRQHHDERGLRLFQAEADLVVARRRDLLEVTVPGFARIDAKLLLGDAGHQIPGAFHIGRGERLAVVPFDALPQLQRQLGAVLVPRPFGCEVRHDRVDAVLPDLRVEGDQVVEHPQHWPLSEDRLLLVDRHAGRAVDCVDLQNTAMFLRLRRIGHSRRKQPSVDDRKHALTEHHLRLLT